MTASAVTGSRRDWAVAVFVVWRGTVLLHEHPKLGRWLPCGGHVEANELPDDAAVREVLEESRVPIVLLGDPPVTVPGPRQLTPPRGVQLERIDDAHEHVDLVYLARPADGYDGHVEGVPTLGWFDREALSHLPLTPEIRAWCELALDEVASTA